MYVFPLLHVDSTSSYSAKCKVLQQLTYNSEVYQTGLDCRGKWLGNSHITKRVVGTARKPFTCWVDTAKQTEIGREGRHMWTETWNGGQHAIEVNTESVPV